MAIPAERFSKAVIAGLGDAERESRLRELESLVNGRLKGSGALPQFQKALYEQIDELTALGYSLGRWDYDSEVETWGGPSYMDQSQVDDLLLRSHFPSGIALAWRDFERLPKDA